MTRLPDDHPFRRAMNSPHAKRSRILTHLREQEPVLRTDGLSDPEERVRSHRHFVMPVNEEWDEDPFRTLADPYENSEE